MTGESEQQVDWHFLSSEETAARLGTDAGRGLAKEEAARRLAERGPNELEERAKKTLLVMFLGQFQDFMILVLIAAAAISGIIGEPSDTIAIVIIVILNAIVGFVQEYRADRAIAALKEIAAQTSTVVRDGAAATVPASELVPGDVVVLEAGNIVPADLRLLEIGHLKIQEAALTGESVPSEKQSGPLDGGAAALGDRKNMAYKGTVVTYGRGVGVVVATGMRTELGRIATMLQEEEEVRTPLQKRLAAFGRRLSIAILIICAVVFVFGVGRGEPALLMLLTAVSLAVAAIPEALPAVVTISLAVGAKRMARMKALIRKLPVVETLGSVTYICSDKTGTLTLNRMTAEEVFVAGRLMTRAELLAAPTGDVAGVVFLTALAVNNDARTSSKGENIGDPTEIALLSLARDAGYEKGELEQQFPRVAEIPFDSERKCMTTFHEGPDGMVSFTKGALDHLLEHSAFVFPDIPLDQAASGEILETGERMARDGLRVLAVAMRRWDGALPDDLSPHTVEKRLVILGLVGMMDPPRVEAIEAVSRCKTAGIVPVMITGDHPLTAEVIARRLGILESGAEAVMTGAELDDLSLEDLEERVEHIRVYARVAPEQKLRIVKALQDRGQFVAMTGDGVNDAPALKRADIGVAMGITGTDVSKEAAHMVILDDDFATIVEAVRDGRRIFDNIRKFIKYTMTSNSGEIWSIFLAPFMGLPIPLLPIHILWINLVTDGLPGLALSPEPAEKGLMERPPRAPNESIFAHGLGLHIVWVGLLMGAVTLFTQAWALKTGNAHWQTMAFTVLCLSQMGHVLAIRSERESVFSQGLLSNKALLGATALTLGLQLTTIYVPALNRVFKTQPLSAADLGLTLALSAIVFFAVEAEKWFRRRSALALEAGGC